jgi:hypothetical protein
MFKSKYIFILLLCAIVKSFPLFSQNKIDFKFTHPDTIMAGSELKLVITIKSIEPISFARLQINLQDGFVPISNKKGAAQFIHSKNTIKWIWISFG